MSSQHEATKSAKKILQQEIEVGEEQLTRPARKLFLAAISAGLDIGFGPLMLATVLAMAPQETVGTRLIGALAYSVGFIIVILGRSELFTEHTVLAVLPLFSGKTTVAKVARLWGVVYAGNMVGAALFATFGARVGLGLGLFARSDLATLSSHLTDFGPWVILGSAVAAGWMMGLVSWLVTAARDTIGQIVIILLVTGSIYLLHLHHSIAGSVEVLMAVFVADVPPFEFVRFLALATLGNAIGGIVFVAGVKFGHISRQPGVSA